MRTSFLLLALAPLLLTGCSDPPATGTITVELTDAPCPWGLLDSVVLHLDGVEVHVTADDDGQSGFYTVAHADFVNVLELLNGVTEFLGEAELPAGEIKQMRLVVDSAFVDVGETRSYLEIPSGESSGLKVFFSPPIELPPDGMRNFLIDVDLCQSITMEPPNPESPQDITGFRFHPVLRIATLSETGTLSGRVISTAAGAPIANATVSLRRDDTVVTSTATGADGTWTILGVEPGQWTVRAEIDGYTSAQTSVEVTARETTASADLVLDPLPAESTLRIP